MSENPSRTEMALVWTALVATSAAAWFVAALLQ